MDERMKALLKMIPQQPQEQGPLTDQLRALASFATRLGLYDAADFIRNASA